MKNSLNTLINALLLLSLPISINSQVIFPPPSSATPSSPLSTPLPSASAPSPSSSPFETPAPTSANSPSPTPTNSPGPSATNNNPTSSSNPPSNSQSNSSPPTQPSFSSPASSQPSSSSALPTIPAGRSQPASSIVIITITRTGADGQVYTSLTSTYTPLPRPTSSSNNSSGGSGGSSGSTWAIIGGIVGGLAGIGAVVFIVFRCTQRRFSDLDDEDVAIKWPELVNRVEDSSTLNPLAARPGLGHGIGEDDVDEKPRLYNHDIAMEPLHSDQRHPGMYDTYQAYPPPPLHPQEHGGYYDPYVGANGTQPAYPGTMNNLGYDEHHQQRSHDLQSQPSVGSSAGLVQHSNSMNSPRTDSRHKLNDQQYPMGWDGSEDIPLTVVNNHQTPSRLHNPYQNSS